MVGGIRMIQALVPAMRERGWGRVIQMSRASAVRTPSNFFPIYATAKAAQTYQVQSLAAELAGSSVTVNAVSPGVVSTDTNRCLLSEEAEREGRPTDWPSLERRYVETMMSDPVVPRMATPEEVYPVVAFLASLLAGHVTGSNYVIDGGYSVGEFRRRGASPSTVAMQQRAVARTAA